MVKFMHDVGRDAAHHRLCLNSSGPTGISSHWWQLPTAGMIDSMYMMYRGFA